MNYIKRTLGKGIMGLKTNRKIALSREDKQLVAITDWKTCQKTHDGGAALSPLSAPSELGSIRCALSAVTSDASLTVVLTIYQKRWKVEEYQNRTHPFDPHTNHPDQSLCGCSLDLYQAEMLKMRTKKNHYALKTQLYLSALQQAFESLCQLDPVRLDLPTA